MILGTWNLTLEAQLPTYWVPVLGPLYKLILSINNSITQEPTIWVPGLLGLGHQKLWISYETAYSDGPGNQIPKGSSPANP